MHTPARSRTAHPVDGEIPEPGQPAGTGAGGTGAFGASVQHYENFPVASWLCPAHLRPAVAAIYHFARAADDIADEGDANASERLQQLAELRGEFDAALQGQAPTTRPDLITPLVQAVRRHQLDPDLLRALISAFEQDVRHTDSGHHYTDLPELLDYCARSANPVGRLLLQLWGVRDETALVRSDQICSALQLINFWQDLSRDLPRRRFYLPTRVLQRHGATLDDFLHPGDTPDAHRKAVVAELCAHARGLMQMGVPLVHQVPGRAGWELRLVVQGGLRVLDRIADTGHRSWQQRVAVDKRDLPLLVWRALWM